MPGFEHPPVPPQGVEDFSRIDLIGASAGTVVLTSKVTADAQTRLDMTAAGEFSWGPGNAAKDIKFGRSAVGSVFIGPATGEGLIIEVAGAGVNILESGGVPGRHLTIGTNASGRNVFIQNEGALVWAFGSLLGGGENFYPMDDNTADIGLSTNRVRSIRWGTQALGGDGTISNPTFSWGLETNSGYYRSGAGDIRLSVLGVDYMRYTSNITILNQNHSLAWGSAGVSAVDTIVARVSAGVVSLSNSGNPCGFRVYQTTTGPKYAAIEHSGTHTLLNAKVDGDQYFSRDSSVLWVMGANTHFYPGTDNAQDNGQSGNKWRSVYFGTQAIGPLGGATAPSFTFTGLTATEGIYSRGAGTVSVSVGGAGNVEFQGSGSVMLASGVGGVYWLPGALGTTPDIILTRSGAGTLSMVNGANPQSLTIFNTVSGGGANWERGWLLWSGNSFYIGTDKGGTGAARDVIFTQGGSNKLILAAGGMYPATDNFLDLGVSGTFRFKSFFFSSQAIGPAGAAGTPSFCPGTANEGLFAASAGDLSFAISGSRLFAMQNGQFYILTNTGYLGIGASPDTLLHRDAANVFAMKNSTNAQEFRVYGTTTGPKYSYWSCSSASATLGCNVNTMELHLGGSAGAVYSDVIFAPGSDAAHDLGGSSVRWRDGFFSSSVRVGTNPATAGHFRMSYGDGVQSRNQANSGNLLLAYASTVNAVTDILLLGVSGTAGVIAKARSGGAAPTTSDLASGEWCVWRDTGGGTTKLYYNNAGAIQSVALA